MGTGRKEMTKHGPVSFKSRPVSCTCRGPAEPDFTQQINVVWMKRVFQTLAAAHGARRRALSVFRLLTNTGSKTETDGQKASRQTQAVTHREERQTDRPRERDTHTETERR